MPMKVRADFDKCEGYANCLIAAPDVFSLDEDDNVVVILMEEPSEDQRSVVEEAVRSCPVAALAIDEG